MNLKEKYQKEVVKEMKSKFGYTNALAVPKIVKVTLNVGIGKGKDDPKVAETAENTLKRISGQSPVYTVSKKSISAFKVREGMKVGLKVTLRGKKMWDFLEKLIGVALPRVRDFRGLNPQIIDRTGNLNIGFKEHIVFPEREEGELKDVFGFEVTVATSARNKEEGVELLRLMGFPIKK